MSIDSIESELNTFPGGKLDSLVNYPKQIRNVTIFAHVLKIIKKKAHFSNYFISLLELC